VWRRGEEERILMAEAGGTTGVFSRFPVEAMSLLWCLRIIGCLRIQMAFYESRLRLARSPLAYALGHRSLSSSIHTRPHTSSHPPSHPRTHPLPPSHLPHISRPPTRPRNKVQPAHDFLCRRWRLRRSENGMRSGMWVVADAASGVA